MGSLLGSALGLTIVVYSCACASVFVLLPPCGSRLGRLDSRGRVLCEYVLPTHSRSRDHAQGMVVLILLWNVLRKAARLGQSERDATELACQDQAPFQQRGKVAASHACCACSCASHSTLQLLCVYSGFAAHRPRRLRRTPAERLHRVLETPTMLRLEG